MEFEIIKKSTARERRHQEKEQSQALASSLPQFKAGQNTIADSIADAGARIKGFGSANDEKKYAAENPNLYSAMGGAKYNPIPSKTPTVLTDEGKQAMENAKRADKGEGIYAYNINSINIADRGIVNSAAQKVKANKLLELTAQEKYTLQKLAREMEETYGETAISEYTGKENIDMFDALWWLTGAYQNTSSQSQMLYQGDKAEKLRKKRIEQAVLSADDFAEKVRIGKKYLVEGKETSYEGGNVLEKFAADYSKTQEKTPLFLEKVKNSKDIYKYMTENEKGVYYYFLGSGKIDAADDYAESLKSSLENRKANLEADNNNFLSNLGDAISTGYFTGAQNIGRSISGLKAATNQTLSELDKKMFETTYDEKLWSEIQTNSGDRKKITNLLLETVNSVASQIPAMVVGSATGQVGYFITMSANIIGGTTTEAINAGYEAQQGFIHGLIESALEATVEKALGGFSSLLKGGSTNTFVKSAIGSVDKAVKNKFIANLFAKTVTTLGQGGAEGVEEFLQELTGPLVRNLIYGENNKYSADTFKDAIHAFAVGALSGMFMSAPYIKGNVNETRAEIIGDVINAAGGVKSVLALAEIAGNDSQLYQSIKEKVNSSIEVDSADIGYLYQESFEKFKNPNTEMMKSFAERNVDAVIAEAQKVQSSTNETAAKNAEYTKATANSKILDLIKKVKSGIFKTNDKEFLNSPSEDVVKQIIEITGIDVSGFKVAIEARQIEHILKDHGENGAADHSMSDDLDIAKMEYTLNSPDSIVLSGTTQAYVTSVNGKNKPAKTVLYEKSLGNNSYYVVQAVPDTKAKTLYIVSAFIGKEGYKKETSQTTDAKSPSATPNSENASVSSDITVPQNVQAVNNNMSEPASFMPENESGYFDDDTGDEMFPEDDFEFTEPSLRDITREPSPEEVIAETISGEVKTTVQRHILDIAKKLDTDLKVEFVKDLPTNGKFLRKSNRLQIRADLPAVQMYIEIFKHEFMHRLETRKLYNSYLKYCFNKSVAFKQYAYVSYEAATGKAYDGDNVINALVGVYYDSYKTDKSIPPAERQAFTFEDAKREVIADFFGDVLFRGKQYRDNIAATLQKGSVINISDIDSGIDALTELAEQDRSLFQRLKDVISEIISWLKGEARNRTLVQDLEYLEKRLEWVYRSADSKKALRKAQSEVKNSIGVVENSQNLSQVNKYDYSNPFAKQVDDYKSGKIPKGDTLLVGSTPSVYQSIGFNALPMTINTTHIDYALKGTKDADHYLGETMLKQLPESIKKPVAIFVSQTKGNSSVVALLNFEVNSNQTVVPIVIDGFGFQNNIRIDSNAITSVYGKGGAINQLYQAAQDEANGKISLLYANKKEAKSLLQSAGHQLSGGLIPRDGFYHSIREKGSSVKNRFNDVTETQQFKRWFGDWKKHPNKASKAVDKDGRPLVMYHGTDADFTEFNTDIQRTNGKLNFGKGIYLTPNKSLAEMYTTTGNVMSLYVAIKNPYEIFSTRLDEFDLQKLSTEFGENVTLDNIDKVLQKNGYDGIIARNYNGATNPINQVIVFNSNQVKSATDNIGTFDSNNPNIQYSLGSPMQQLRYNPEAYAKHLNRKYGAKADTNSITRKLRQITIEDNKSQKAQDATREAVYNKKSGEKIGDLTLKERLINEVAAELSESIVAPLSPYSAEVMELIKEKPLRVTAEQEAEIRYQYGTLTNYCKETGIRLRKDTDDNKPLITLESIWNGDWSVIYPELFKTDVKDLEMPTRLAEIVDRLNSMTEEIDTERIAESVSEQINSTLNETGPRAEKRRVNEAYRKGVEDEHRKNANKLKDLQKQNTRLKNRVKPKDVQNIRAEVERIYKKLAANTATKHVPQDLKKAVSEFLNMFLQNDAFAFKPSDREKVTRLWRAYSKLEGPDAESMAYGYDAQILVSIEVLEEMLPGRSLWELHPDELTEVKKIIHNINFCIENVNTMIVDGRKQDIADTAVSVISELGRKKGKAIDLGKLNLDMKNTTPVAFFEKCGSKTLQALFKDIKRGEGIWAQNMLSARNHIDALKKKHGYNKWDDRTLKFTTKLGDEIELDIEQALLLYATIKRERNNVEQEAEHTYIGGVVIPTKKINSIVRQLKGFSKRGNESAEAANSRFNSLVDTLNKEIDVAPHQIRVSDFQKVSDFLTSEQKAYADDMVEYLSNDMAKLGNEVSMQLFGIERFNEKYYIPYNSASNFIASFPGVEPTSSIKHRSFTKDLTHGANNPLILTSFSEVCASHIEQMCMYNSMAIPVDNLTRVLNSKTVADEGITSDSVKNSIEHTMGKSGLDYINNLIRDMNGSVRASSMDSIVGFLTGRYKKIAVLASASVVIQQPTSIVRAFKYIPQKYFWATTFKGAERDYEQMKKYVGEAIIKEMGGFDAGIGSTNNEYLLNPKKNVFEKIDDAAAWAANKADQITWAHIWAASKRMVAAQNRDIKVGSDEFFKKAAEICSEAISKTQVYDSILVKSEAMRSKDPFAKMATAFMSEPTVTYNMITTSLQGIKEGKKGAWKDLAHTSSIILMQIVFNAAMKSLVYAMRDDDENETYFEKYLSSFTESVTSDMNFLNYLPFAKDFVSLMQGYSVERMDMAAVTDVVKALKKMFDDEASELEKAKSLCTAVSLITGVPIKNIWRDLEGAFKTIRSAIKDDYKNTFAGVKFSALSGFEDAINWVPGVNVDIDGTDKLIKELKGNENYEALNLSDKKKIKKGVSAHLKVERQYNASDLLGNAQQFTSLFDIKRQQGSASSAYKNKKKELLENGLSEKDIENGVEIAKFKYLKENGISVAEYYMIRASISQKDKNNKYIHDADNSNGLSAKEKRDAIDDMSGFSSKEKNILKNIIS